MKKRINKTLKLSITMFIIITIIILFYLLNKTYITLFKTNNLEISFDSDIEVSILNNKTWIPYSNKIITNTMLYKKAKDTIDINLKLKAKKQTKIYLTNKSNICVNKPINKALLANIKVAFFETRNDTLNFVWIPSNINPCESIKLSMNNNNITYSQKEYLKGYVKFGSVNLSNITNSYKVINEQNSIVEFKNDNLEKEIVIRIWPKDFKVNYKFDFSSINKIETISSEEISIDCDKLIITNSCCDARYIYSYDGITWLSYCNKLNNYNMYNKVYVKRKETNKYYYTNIYELLL